MYVTIIKYHICFAENIYIDYINTCVICIFIFVRIKMCHIMTGWEKQSHTV